MINTLLIGDEYIRLFIAANFYVFFLLPEVLKNDFTLRLTDGKLIFFGRKLQNYIYAKTTLNMPKIADDEHKVVDRIAICLVRP